MSEGESGHKLTARQKLTIYITTVAILGFLYIAPELFRFMLNLPDTAWKAIGIPLAILAGGGILVAFYAIWSVFSTAKAGIRKDAERERAELALRSKEKGENS